jgi:hypothetical protein
MIDKITTISTQNPSSASNIVLTIGIDLSKEAFVWNPHICTKIVSY